jgi:hypothetical protein
MTAELTPCPFCGGEAHFQPQQGNNPAPFSWDVIHHCDHGFIRFGGGFEKITQEQAAALWNRRATPAEARSASPEWRPDLEAVARVIDPDAWAYFDTDAGQHNTTDLLRFDAWKQSSLRKAKAILALPTPPKA